MNSPGFSVEMFPNMFLFFILAPAFGGILLIWLFKLAPARYFFGAGLGQTKFGGGRLELWTTEIVATLMALADCALWLTWSDFSPTLPHIPARRQYPVWQILGFGITVIATNLLAAWWAKFINLSGQAAALGTAVWFSTTFAIDGASMVASQQGIVVMLAMFGSWPALVVLNILVSLFRIDRSEPTGQPEPNQ